MHTYFVQARFLSLYVRWGSDRSRASLLQAVSTDTFGVFCAADNGTIIRSYRPVGRVAAAAVLLVRTAKTCDGYYRCTSETCRRTSCW